MTLILLLLSLLALAAASGAGVQGDTYDDVPAICRSEKCISQWRDDGHCKQDCFKCGKLYADGFLAHKFPPVGSGKVTTPQQVYNSVARPDTGYNKPGPYYTGVVGPRGYYNPKPYSRYPNPWLGYW